MKITKVSGRKYTVSDSNDQLIFTIKRLDSTTYKVKNTFGDTITFDSLQGAKAHVRAYPDTKPEHSNWLSYFVQHTRGKKFESQEKSNEHMKNLAEEWKCICNQRLKDLKCY